QSRSRRGLVLAPGTGEGAESGVEGRSEGTGLVDGGGRGGDRGAGRPDRARRAGAEPLGHRAGRTGRGCGARRRRVWDGGVVVGRALARAVDAGRLPAEPSVRLMVWVADLLVATERTTAARRGHGRARPASRPISGRAGAASERRGRSRSDRGRSSASGGSEGG